MAPKAPKAPKASGGTVTAYYGPGDLKKFTTGNLNSTDPTSIAYNLAQLAQIYSDKELKTKSGSIAYDISIKKSLTTVIDSELATVSFPEGSFTFTATIAGSKTPGEFTPGKRYKFGITGGTDIYLGAGGTVDISVSKGGIRTLILQWIYQ
jgi:hypothetical protein